MAFGECGQRRARTALVLLEVHDLQRPEAVGEHPQEVGQVRRHHTALALRAQEHHGLLDEGPPRPHAPQGGEATGAVLSEDPVGVAVQLVVAGPVAQPVGGLLGGVEGVVRLEVHALAVVVVELHAGHVGQGGRKGAVARGRLDHVRQANRRH